MTTAVIVGHGPSPKGRGWGKHIDAAETVVRMFDCGWQSPEDYGTRYDIGVVTLAARQLNWFATEATRRPALWWLYRQDGAWFSVKGETPQEMFTVDQDRQTALDIGAQTLGGNFALTRGTAAACNAIRRLGVGTVVLVGFDEVRARRFSQQPYSPECLAHMQRRPDCPTIGADMTARAPDQTQTLGHDVSVEMDVIMKAAAECGVNALHADEVW